jgi:hypothetical protein
MSSKLRRGPELFRVVEVARDGRGRLVQQGQIWHSDLDHVRRFGRAVAANSVSQRVLIADSTGAVVEQIPVAPLGSAVAGWSGWRDMPLPPAPPRKKPRPAPPLRQKLPEPAVAAAAVAAAPVVPVPPVPPVPSVAPVAPDVQAVAPAFNPETTAPLPPGATALPTAPEGGPPLLP